MGFSVTGRVLNGLEGEGVPDASVSINNQIKGNCRQTDGGVVEAPSMHEGPNGAVLFPQSPPKKMVLSGWRT